MSKVKVFSVDLLLAIVLGLAGLFVFSGVAEAVEQGDLHNHVIRLHILGADNSRAEQALKLTLRDEVWGFVRDLVAEAPSMPHARAIIGSNLDLIEAKAERVSDGRDVQVRLVEGLPFPPMTYAHIFLPQGDYHALQIIIGEGAGDNWWCIMFPAMCLMDITQGQVAELPKEKAEEVVLRPRFRIAELFR